MPGLIYSLCAATALTCSAMLWRSYRRNGVRLLFWSSVCFLGLAAESVLLYVDRIVYSQVDLSLYRNLLGLAALSSLIFALIWDSK
jgi:hypothetical protein